MLTFLTGTYFSAKKKYISEKINLLTENGERVYLIVPEQSSFDRERDFLFAYGERKSSRLTVTSFAHLAHDILEEYGLKIKPEADEAAKNIIMSLAAEDAGDFSDIYSKYAGRPQLIRQLLSEYSEIKQAGLGPDDLQKVRRSLPECTLRKKAEELSVIFSIYESLLGERFSDSSDNISVISRFLPEHKVFAGAYVFFDDFRGFTAAQAKLAAEIASQCEQCFISVNAPSSVNAEDSEAWLHAVKNCREIRKRAAEKNVRCCSENIKERNPVEALAAVESSLFCGEKEIFTESTDSVVLISAENKYAECDIAALHIKKLIEENGCRCRDIAVEERGGGYTKIMISALKKYGIPVFEDKRVPLFEYPLVRMLLSAVNIAVYGFSSETVFSYIKTGMAGISTEECSALENYVYIWDIDRNAWLKPFTGSVSGYGNENNAENERRLTELNSIREKITAPLLRLKSRLLQRSGGEQCKAVFEFLTEINASDEFLKYAEFLYSEGSEAGAAECAAAWDTVMQSLDALYAVLEKRQVKPARFFELLKIILSSGDIGRIPSGIDEIVIGRADRTRFLEPKAVFLLGANEGVFPAAVQSAGLFSSKERKLLGENNFPIKNCTEDIYTEERMIAYASAIRATQKLYISYSRSSLSGEKKEPSVLTDEIKKIVPNCKTVYDKAVAPIDKIGSEESAFELCACLFRENSQFSASLKEYIRGSSYAGRLEALENENSGAPLKIEDKETARELFGTNMYITPSKAEAYYKCPFMYFCKYGMRISRLLPARLDARINGLLVHYALEMIFSRCSAGQLREKTETELRGETDSIIEEYIEKFMGGRQQMSLLLNRSLDKTKTAVFDIVSRLRLEFGTSRFIPCDTELFIGPGGDITPYFLRLPDAGSIAVGGYVDRVDTMEENGKKYLRVIDYKTGGKDFRLSDVFDGLNMQMLIYLMCLWDNGKERYGDIIPAGILYVPAKNSGENLGRNADAAEITGQKLKNGRMNGMILADENVIKGMEAAAQGRFINAEIDKAGRLKGTLISLEDLRILHKKIDSMLINLGAALHSGRIEAFPAVDSAAYKNTCTFCDYADICRHSAGSPERTPLALSHGQAIKYLEEDAENV